MAMHRAFPPKFGEIDRRRLTPAFSTLVVRHRLERLVHRARRSSAATSDGDVLAWSVDGVGLMIAYYYGQTGFACVIYYRRYIFKSVKNFIFVGLLPLIGGLTLAFIFVWSIKDMTDPDVRGPGRPAGSA